MDVLHTTEVMAIFVIFGLFWPKFGCHRKKKQTPDAYISPLWGHAPI